MTGINWIAYSYNPLDGYGNYSRYLVRALTRIGVSVTPLVLDQVRLPMWMQQLAGINYSKLTISCLPPYMLARIPGRQWILTMTEGSKLPCGWDEIINERAQRVIVPCPTNAETFRRNVDIPVHVVPGGTSPEQFPLLPPVHKSTSQYTFLTLADRGGRKGWAETWTAFYKAFGMPDETPDAHLLVKTRLHTNNLIDLMMPGTTDPRIQFWNGDVNDMADVYAAADCFVIPSRSEGWGMPQREAAMMGLPVIVTRHTGLDDGHTDEWAIVVEKTARARIPRRFPKARGEWQIANVDELAEKMRWCYDNREAAAQRGQRAAAWLREHQTWAHSARDLLSLIEEYA